VKSRFSNSWATGCGRADTAPEKANSAASWRKCIFGSVGKRVYVELQVVNVVEGERSVLVVKKGRLWKLISFIGVLVKWEISL
jgi:hypothetical protein